MAKLLRSLPQIGKVEWIGLRPARRVGIVSVETVEVTEKGLTGDRYQKMNGKRQVTLIQAEHLTAVGQLMQQQKTVDPQETRRNLVISGINLNALKNQQFQIGSAVVLEGTGYCHPCSRMEENLGPGGYNAMRGHGGITARILQTGTIRVGDSVRFISPSDQPDTV